MTDIKTEVIVIEESEPLTPTWIAENVVGWSVRFVVTSTIVSLVPIESKTDKVKVVIGSYMIASVVADQTKVQLHKKIADTKEYVAELKKAIAQVKSETPTP